MRSEDVLFVDDEEANLGEAAFYNPKINTLNALNDHANAVLKSIVSANVTDDRKRFRQYRNLEKKNIVRMEYSDNKIFLRESGIEIWLDHRCELYLERIEELVNRTNQLNFTKNRLSADQLMDVLKGTNENSVVFARDRFGDYGLIGFVSYKRSTNELVHFVFSCRTLNMGIEQYIYDKFECPLLNIAGEVSTKLTRHGEVNWIREIQPPHSATLQKEAKPLHILIAGSSRPLPGAPSFEIEGQHRHLFQLSI